MRALQVAVIALVIDVKLAGDVSRVFTGNIGHRFPSFHADEKASFVTPGLFSTC